MFTGIIQALGTIDALSGTENDKTLTINVGDWSLDDVSIGDSIAIDGVCLTVTELKDRLFCVDVSSETLNRTTLSTLRKGNVVNMEKAMTPNTFFGGHIVSGHVDGVVELLEKYADGACYRYVFSLPEALARYLAIKGSVTLNGVSLTINGVTEVETDSNVSKFDVLLIPHTETVTNLGKLVPGDRVNLEVDLIARYVERILMVKTPKKGIKPGLTLDDIRRFGL